MGPGLSPGTFLFLFGLETHLFGLKTHSVAPESRGGWMSVALDSRFRGNDDSTNTV